jgi:FAD/FMN-containing dehydrogenase
MRRTILCVATVLCLWGPVVGGYERASAVTYSNNRIAIDADGNYNDRDDWAATPMGLALLARRGLQSRLVHYSWANIIGPNNPTFYNEMKTSTLGAADRFGFNRAKFFDCRNNLQGAITSLTNQINASTSSNRLFVIAVGPMEVLWRAVNASDAAKRQYVTVISHTNWNANTTYPPTMTHTRADVEALGVQWIQIKDQNVNLYTRKADGSPNWSPWFWLRDKPSARMRWIYDRMIRTGKPDVSDAGVVYYLLTNIQNATPYDLRNFFLNWQ